ncbi:hypothetical protein [Bradyrhizobium sp.]|uniref:hypothetical protein n=1 Tax=Bradyrhizobium sp. TaxID=376 RepID=UPI003C4031A8
MVVATNHECIQTEAIPNVTSIAFDAHARAIQDKAFSTIARKFLARLSGTDVVTPRMRRTNFRSKRLYKPSAAGSRVFLEEIAPASARGMVRTAKPLN